MTVGAEKFSNGEQDEPMPRPRICGGSCFGGGEALGEANAAVEGPTADMTMMMTCSFY